MRKEEGTREEYSLGSETAFTFGEDVTTGTTGSPESAPAHPSPAWI